MRVHTRNHRVESLWFLSFVTAWSHITDVARTGQTATAMIVTFQYVITAGFPNGISQETNELAAMRSAE